MSYNGVVGNGGLILGLLTALLGRQGIWICTAAVEAAVHRHLEDQLLFLRDRDSNLYSLIKAIQSEELMHLRHAEERIAVRTFPPRLLSAFIAKSTDTAIWLSTWGDSTRMARDLAVTTPKPWAFEDFFAVACSGSSSTVALDRNRRQLAADHKRPNLPHGLFRQRDASGSPFSSLLSRRVLSPGDLRRPRDSDYSLTPQSRRIEA
jgi:Ubiquinone biosynthesis protein COQ7